MTGKSICRSAPIHAAQYVRMSSEHQYFSTETQKNAIAEYANAHDIEIVATYADEGKSGLSLRGRAGLKKLLTDAINPARTFNAILIYDVSRWGRFRDPDEAAHYEFLCRQAGVDVIYCAEPFTNDFSPTSGILKNLKRVMAHEYSRELSEKLSRAHLQQARLGYKQGGPLVYGFSRQVVDANNNPKFILRTGQHKAVRDDKVRFALGAPAEQDVIRLIFHLYVDEGLSAKKVVERLRATNVLAKNGRRWTEGRIYALLKNELCIGLYLYNRTSAKLQARLSRNPEEEWVRVSAGIPSVISYQLFAKAQSCLETRRSKKLDSERLLQDLRSLVESKGYLSQTVIDAEPGLASTNAYKSHFGKMSEAWRLIGYQKPMSIDKRGRVWRREETLKALAALYAAHGFLSCDLIDEDDSLPSYQTIKKHFGKMGEIYALIGAPPKTQSEIFKEARERFGEKRRGSHLSVPRVRWFSTELILQRLKSLLSKHGYLSIPLLKADPALPSIFTIAERFGSVVEAYRAAGWEVNASTIATLRNERRYAQRGARLRSPLSRD